MNIKSLEERIVNLTKVTADGEKTTVEAELRQLKMQGGIPKHISVVLTQKNNLLQRHLRKMKPVLGKIVSLKVPHY